jgi:hypothetical protein
MTVNNYSSQILATVAAASINFDGSTPITYGCSITRFSSGVYKLILPTGDAVINSQSFTRATGKFPFAATACLLVVSDETDYIKTVTAYDGPNSPSDTGVEIVVQRSTISG